jgi:hypothetical protein
MRKFAPLDDLLIERLFQPLSDLILDRTGFNRTAVACFCTDAGSMAWVASRAPGLSDAVAAWDAAAAFLDLSLLLLGLAALISLRTVFRRAAAKQANPLRRGMRGHRGIVLVMLLARLAEPHAFGLAYWADVVMLLFAASALYVGACERPPIRRWTSFVPASSQT